MAGIAQGFCLLDAAGNPISSVLDPVPPSGFNPFLFQGSINSNNGVPISGTNPLPTSEETVGVQITSSSGPIVAGNAGSANLAGTAGKTTYIRGFAVSSQVVAAAVGGVVTVTGLIVGTIHFQYVETVASGGLLIISFGNAGLAASAQNTAIAVNLPAIAGGAASAVSAWGVQI